MTMPAACVALVLAGALAVAGCGGDEQPPPAPVGAGPTLTVTETDFALDPTAARLPRAGAARVEVVNRGQTVHALAVETADGTRSTARITPGRSSTLSLTLPAGRYVWYCPVGNHRQLGMRGTLTVGERGSGPESEQPAREAPGGGGLGY